MIFETVAVGSITSTGHVAQILERLTKIRFTANMIKRRDTMNIASGEIWFARLSDDATHYAHTAGEVQPAPISVLSSSMGMWQRVSKRYG